MVAIEAIGPVVGDCSGGHCHLDRLAHDPCPSQAREFASAMDGSAGAYYNDRGNCRICHVASRPALLGIGFQIDALDAHRGSRDAAPLANAGRSRHAVSGWHSTRQGNGSRCGEGLRSRWVFRSPKRLAIQYLGGSDAALGSGNTDDARLDALGSNEIEKTEAIGVRPMHRVRLRPARIGGALSGMRRADRRRSEVVIVIAVGE